MYLKLLLIICCSLILFGKENVTTNEMFNEIFKRVQPVEMKNSDKIVYKLGYCWYSFSNKPNEFAQIYIMTSSKEFQVKIIKSNLEKGKKKKLIKCIVSKLIDVKKELNETITFKTKVNKN